MIIWMYFDGLFFPQKCGDSNKSLWNSNLSWYMIYCEWKDTHYSIGVSTLQSAFLKPTTKARNFKHGQSAWKSWHPQRGGEKRFNMRSGPLGGVFKWRCISRISLCEDLGGDLKNHFFLEMRCRLFQWLERNLLISVALCASFLWIWMSTKKGSTFLEKFNGGISWNFYHLHVNVDFLVLTWIFIPPNRSKKKNAPESNPAWGNLFSSNC